MWRSTAQKKNEANKRETNNKKESRISKNHQNFEEVVQT